MSLPDRLFRLLLAGLVCAGLAACASAPFAPEPLADPESFSSFQTRSIGDVTVAVAILTDEEAKKHFGVDLKANGLQALWVSVRNASELRYWLIRNTVDQDLYSADETFQLVKDEVDGADQERLRQHLRDESIRVMMRPGHVTRGHIFLPYREGGRYAEIRLTPDAYHEGQQPTDESGYRELRFGFGLTLPDGEFDYEHLDQIIEEQAARREDLDLGGLRNTLEALPCCVTNSDGDANGDPLNLVLVGEATDVMNALSRLGWSFTHRITAESVRRMMAAALEGKGYAVAPVSSLFVFGRKQDIALQRSRANIAQRNHMRLWLAPFTLEGRSVWVGQVSRDIGVKLTTHSPSLTTHIIDPQVDLTRLYLLHGLLAEGFVEKFGYVSGSSFAAADDPAFNLAEDPYFSDGMRLVVMLSADPVPYSEVRTLGWESSAEPVVEGYSGEASRNLQPIGH
jgi:hypothetical protein